MVAHIIKVKKSLRSRTFPPINNKLEIYSSNTLSLNVLYKFCAASSSSPIACGSLLPFQKNCKDASSRDYYHWITYIFVHERYKGEGYGSLLLQHMQYDAWLIARHPIRADVAHKAVNFFTKNGYVINGKVWTPIAGSSYFRRLHPMQIDFKIPQPEEEWDPC